MEDRIGLQQVRYIIFKLNDGIKFTLGKEVEINGKKYWRWQVDGNTNQFGFSFTNNWREIDNTNYYRTVLASVIFSQAGGKVFASDGKASKPINNQEVYALKDITAEIANKMPLYFYDFTGKVTTPVKVVYSLDSSFSTETAGTTKSVEMKSVDGFPHLYTVELEKTEIEAKPYVKFTGESGKRLGDIYYF
mgnify:FL=1